MESNGVELSVSGFQHQGYDFISQGSAHASPWGTTRHQSPIKQTARDASINRNSDVDPKDPEIIESLFVCVKAQSTLETICGLLPRLTPKSTIVLLQNGMGVYDELITQVFPDPLRRPHIVSAAITHGAWIRSSLHVVHAGVGKIDFGIMSDGHERDFEATRNGHARISVGDLSPLPSLSVDDIAPKTQEVDIDDRYRSLRDTVEVLLRMQPLQVSWIPIHDILMSMRRKVVVNAVINPITALLNCENGLIFSHPEGSDLCRAVCQEAEAVFRAQWEADGGDAGTHGRADAAGFPSSLGAEQLETFCKEVAVTTAQNTSSMLMDVRLGRQTEVQYMTGYLIGLGHKYRVRTPTNLSLFNMVKLKTALQQSSPSQRSP
ncbi:hypothetical protein EUX98_g740 [Antrodiella citrinella]|uniref:2-dehydropantoate 2-reductase n=1 Tax=Antrodiella citrinella TaxID=2447956 RepID=A0A4S4N665_9APHY|nr:hypothetical protein EUX98_g740 [Antrodiella citrinella]